MPPPDAPAAPAIETTPAPTGAQPTPPAAPEARPPEEKRDPLSPRFAALARDTQRLAKEKQAFSAERQRALDEVKREREALAAARQELDDYKKQRAAIKTDPETFFRSNLGDDWYDLATQIRLSGGKPPPSLEVQAIRDESRAEVEKLRAEQAEWRKHEEERRQAEADAVRKAAQEEAQQNVATFEAEVIEAVKANAETYELISLNGVEAWVPQVIRATFEQSKKLLSWKEAADLLEQQLDALEEQKIQKSKKLAAKWAAHSTQKPPAEQTNGQARTLTNDVGATPRQASVGAPSNDRYAQAMAAYDAVIAKGRAG